MALSVDFISLCQVVIKKSLFVIINLFYKNERLIGVPCHINKKDSTIIISVKQNNKLKCQFSKFRSTTLTAKAQRR